MKIHLLGPSGSGTTTLGRALAGELGLPHFDTDDFFWMKTDPPFTDIRPVEERKKMLRKTLQPLDSWILSGSMIVWGDFLMPELDLVIYKYLEPEMRIFRLKERERKHFGDRIDPGGDMHRNHTDFLEWARSYETAGPEERSLVSEIAWIVRLSCPVIRIEGQLPVPKEVERVLSFIKGEEIND